MNKKTLTFFIMMQLIITTIIPLSGDIQLEENTNSVYPQDFEIYATSGGYAPWADIFRLEIHPNGECVYSIVYPEDKNEGNGEWTIIADFELTENQMDQLWETIENNDFFNLSEYYTGSAVDGTFSNVKITANGITYSVKTENIPVAQVDKIVKKINSFTPGDYDLFYNDVIFNTQPDKPSKPSGSASGKINREQTYSSTTTDPNGDVLYYLFDWDDGSTSGWVGPYNSGEIGSATHTWTTKGNYQIRVKVKDDPNADGDLSDGDESDWSDPYPISMPKTNHQSLVLFNTLFQQLINRFPFIKDFFFNIGFKTYLTDNSETKFTIFTHEPDDVSFNGNSGTSVTIDGCDITVEIRIQISGEGATDDLATDIEDDIEDVWNDDWKIECKDDCERKEPGCSVTFDANVSKLGENETADEGSHQIEIKNDPSGKGISSVNLPLPTPNGGSSGSGTWDNNEPDHTWAHEAGHLMGLGDCYEVISEDPYRTRPRPGCQGNIMADLSGSPSQDNISQIVEDGGVECPCECCPEPDDNETPENNIQQPENDSKVSSPLTVIGTADDDVDGSGIAKLDFKLEWDGGSQDGTEYLIDPPKNSVSYKLGPINLGAYIDQNDWMLITTYAIDAAGNIGQDSVYVTWIEDVEDTIPPVTEKTVGEPNMEDGYMIYPITPIWLNATDEGGSGVQYIYYEIAWDNNDDGLWDETFTETVYTDSVEIHTEFFGIFYGLIELRWYAVDNANNEESMHYQEHLVIE